MANEVERSYDEVADEYAARIFEELDHKPFDREILDRFAESARSIGTVCDLGCGPGQVARYLHSRGAKVCGIDLSKAMIEAARKQNSGLDIDFRTGDMRSLPIADQALGGIAAFYSIIHIEPADRPTAFAEMRRVLRPGGVLLLAFHKGEETIHLDEWWGRSVSIDFYFLRPDVVIRSLIEAGFMIEDQIERDPLPEVEYQSRRIYILARRPVDPTVDD